MGNCDLVLSRSSRHVCSVFELYMSGKTFELAFNFIILIYLLLPFNSVLLTEEENKETKNNNRGQTETRLLYFHVLYATNLLPKM